jgi:hypothetical protein
VVRSDFPAGIMKGVHQGEKSPDGGVEAFLKDSFGRDTLPLEKPRAMGNMQPAEGLCKQGHCWFFITRHGTGQAGCMRGSGFVGRWNGTVSQDQPAVFLYESLDLLNAYL